MATRAELQNALTNLWNAYFDGKYVARVYYDPPESVKMLYPCIVYEYSNAHLTRGNNRVYLKGKMYNLKLIFTDPDEGEEFEDWLESHMPCCNGASGCYVSDNLYHFPVTLTWTGETYLTEE